MPVIIDSNSGPTDGLIVFAGYLLCNIIMLSIYLWRTIWWFTCIRNKPQIGYNSSPSFYRYVIHDGEMGLVEMNTLMFIVINGFALFMVGSWWIYHLLGGGLPLY